jgi:DNA invertase Pin-like site-specific DNA recombinase
MLETDAEQLRRHIGWLLEDLRIHSTSLNGQAATIDVLADELAGYLAHCERFDALLRQVREATEYEFSQHGVSVEFVTQNFDNFGDEAIGGLLRSVMAFGAQKDRDTIRERVMRGRRTKLEQRKVPGYGVPPYGCTKDRKAWEYVIDEAQATIVRRIFHEIGEAGTSLRKLADQLRSRRRSPGDRASDTGACGDRPRSARS